MKNSFTFVDLFAGIGGFRIALSNIGGKCVLSSEIDKECQKTYFENFNEIPFGDIAKLSLNSIPEHDILCAGFPCQPFSICGKKKGFEDKRGNLFFNIIGIIKEKRPKVIFLENVKHLKDHDKGETLNTIINLLEEEGYFVKWKILNSKDFGLAQNRERIIIICTKNKSFNFDKIQRKSSLKIKDILVKRSDFNYLAPEEYTILDESFWKKQESGLIFCGYRNKSIRKNGVRENTEHLSRVHKQPNRIYHVEGTHPTLPSQESSGRFFVFNGEKVRKLTIDECFKLQGFPDNYKKISSLGELYRQIGNSVSIPMIQSIANEIVLSHLEEAQATIKDSSNSNYQMKVLSTLKLF